MAAPPSPDASPGLLLSRSPMALTHTHTRETRLITA